MPKWYRLHRKPGVISVEESVTKGKSVVTPGLLTTILMLSTCENHKEVKKLQQHLRLKEQLM